MNSERVYLRREWEDMTGQHRIREIGAPLPVCHQAARLARRGDRGHYEEAHLENPSVWTEIIAQI